MTSYVELCAGLGGFNRGLELAGWDCLLSADIDKHAVAAHRHAVGPAECLDVTQLDAETLPIFDVLVAGFPCQPFSTSGPKLGFGHRSGNVFSALCDIIRVRRPSGVLLENVPGILSHDKGQTFRTILQSFNDLSYSVEWATIDLAWFGIPQTRPRVFITAFPRATMERHMNSHQDRRFLFSEFEWGAVFRALLNGLEQPLQRGKFRVSHPRILSDEGTRPLNWSGYGLLHGDALMQGSVPALECSFASVVLGSAIAPRLTRHTAIRPVRFYARGKPTFMHLRDEPIGYCLGNIPGGAPLFAASLDELSSTFEISAFLEFANWSREQQEHVVMRLSPERALYLFGEEAADMAKGLNEVPLTLSKKYELVGNMVAPRVATAVAASVGDVLGTTISAARRQA